MVTIISRPYPWWRAASIHCAGDQGRKWSLDETSVVWPWCFVCQHPRRSLLSAACDDHLSSETSACGLIPWQVPRPKLEGCCCGAPHIFPLVHFHGGKGSRSPATFLRPPPALSVGRRRQEAGAVQNYGFLAEVEVPVDVNPLCEGGQVGLENMGLLRLWNLLLSGCTICVLASVWRYSRPPWGHDPWT